MARLFLCDVGELVATASLALYLVLLIVVLSGNTWQAHCRGVLDLRETCWAHDARLLSCVGLECPSGADDALLRGCIFFGPCWAVATAR